MLKSFILPPSSRFLDKLAKIYLKDLEEKGKEPHEVAFIFPTRRACLYFTQSLISHIGKGSFFLPKIFSWEEFIIFCGGKLIDTPWRLLSQSGYELLLLRTLKELDLSFRNPYEDIYWARHYLQVFEEFEKENLTPKDLKIPPDGIPSKAQEFLENLSKVYDHFKALTHRYKYLSQAELLKKLAEKLKDEASIKQTGIKTFYFCGFAALRKVETNFLKAFIELAKKDIIEANFAFAWNSSNGEIHQVIQKTIFDLDLKPEDFDGSKKLPSVAIHPTSDIHEEVELVISNLKQDVKDLSNDVLPRKIAVIVPREETLLALIHALEEFKDIEINIAQSFPLYHHPINQLLLMVIKTQKERFEDQYPLVSYLELLNQPLLRALFPTLSSILDKLSENLKNKYERLSLAKIEEIFKPSNPNLSKIHTLFFKNWENINDPLSLAKALEDVLKRLLPLFPEDDPVFKAYLAYLHTEVFPLYKSEELWEKLTENGYPLYQLQRLLENAKYYLSGEPLIGLQILGFLETRLLNFEKVYILDLNEGVLPPRDDFNPLLTDEMRFHFGLPVFTSSLWDYYFLTFVDSVEYLNITYVRSEGEDLDTEPSRYIYRLKYLFAKHNQDLSKKTIPRSFPKRVFQKGIEVKKEHREILFSYLKDQKVSRYFFETYLKCPAKFYFKYLLNLKEEEGISAILGKIVHKAFQELLTPWISKKKNGEESSFINFEEVAQNVDSVVDKIWEKPEFSTLDPITTLMAKKLIKGFLGRYFKSCAERGVKRKVLAVEEEIQTILQLENFEGLEKVNLYGRCDLIMEEEKYGSLQYLILDLKTSPSATFNSQSFTKSLINMPKDFIPPNSPDEYLKILDDWKQIFGSKLQNFQLAFYLSIETKGSNLTKSSYSSVVPGIIRITLKDDIELSCSIKINELPRIQENIDKVLKNIIKHMLTTPYFFFYGKGQICVWCSYNQVCLGYKVERLP